MSAFFAGGWPLLIGGAGLLAIVWLRYTPRLDEEPNPCHIDTVDGEGD